MNNKEAELYRLLNVAVDCCAMKVDDKGTMSVTTEEVIGKSRKENVVMTRSVLVCLILHAGYSVTTCADFLHRTIAAVRHLEGLSDVYLKTSKAYRIALAEATLKARDEGLD